MTALIFLFMFINFADKAVLGLAAQPLMAELQLSPEQFGLIGSAFFLLFPVSAVLVGFVTAWRRGIRCWPWPSCGRWSSSRCWA